MAAARCYAGVIRYPDSGGLTAAAGIGATQTTGTVDS